DPLCSLFGSPLGDGNTWGVRALLAFSVCIMAHYGTWQNMSIGKTTDQKVSGSNPLGRATFDGRILSQPLIFRTSPRFWARSVLTISGNQRETLLLRDAF